MKTATIATLLLTATSATAFTTSPRISTTTTTTSTSLNLFGSKPKDPNSPEQPGMMDQLAMFKKAQEIAQKKKKLDDELSQETITGTAADGNIEITVKYIPPQLPTNPTPGYEASAVNINEEYLEGVACEELSAMVVEAIRDGESKATARVGEKYKELEEDMKGIMGGMGGQ
mmetsp:Transcript_3316/g.4796  ORF Transcript_3316/g.4796 Transcript_3316/m.4796 type:complete len:172 (+) Transcript_3316:63-578(+)|eukprot:CAMPEP_0201691062 /NCGR_PEP_ID=MMETSP0578-20130828/4326_1 /ASSEMBLY_ACC=CAM_ASM_000663 /TAXON_ID=267565 /ORGANISM="Skeletonema grethea, Strain CCMP 1804" /LENGTH=171 /DNA_ID=CAMNT_0048176191 /DNA_START=20 /DNA_END=535 /DNA_ORIENTATION=-